MDDLINQIRLLIGEASGLMAGDRVFDSVRAEQISIELHNLATIRPAPHGLHTCPMCHAEHAILDDQRMMTESQRLITQAHQALDEDGVRKITLPSGAILVLFTPASGFDSSRSVLPGEFPPGSMAIPVLDLDAVKVMWRPPHD